jgi:DNA-binding GntR family transcriptional regulator
VPDVDEANESRPPAICDACEVERKRHGGYSSSRVCAVCYVEIKAQCVGVQTKLGSPLLMIRETTYDAQNIPIESSVSLRRGDRYTASVISVRKG